MLRTMKFHLYMTVLCCAHVRCDLYSSVEDLQHAARAVDELQRKLGEHIRTKTQFLEILLKKTSEMEATVRQYLEDPGYRLSHPIHAFLFTQSAVLDWDKLVDFKYGTSLLQYRLPNFEDLQGSAVAIGRLQETYNLRAHHIAAGDLYGLKSPILSAYDCFNIGFLNYDVEKFRVAHDWLTVANRSLTQEKTPTIDEDQVIKYLALSEMELEEEEEDDWLDEDEEDEEEEEEEEQQQQQRYKALCRGEDLMMPRKQHELVCRYVSGEPHVTLSRFKEEELYKEPWVVLYHDVISDEHIRALKQLAKPELMRSQTTGGSMNYRISKSAFLSELYRPVQSLNAKIEAMTGLSMETAENLQVANYGLGGFFGVHTDHGSSFRDSTEGNRIATFMAYLSDVEAGGATVFPNIGVKMFPKKGSAIFWYNLKRSGLGDWNTLHAACPVVSGSKWVVNKWIRERGNEFTRPCTPHSWQ